MVSLGTEPTLVADDGGTASKPAHLNRTSTFSKVHKRIESFSVIKIRANCASIDVSSNRITSFKGLPDLFLLTQLNLDGNGAEDIDTGVGFFDHMLELFAHHGGFDLTVKCKGDTRVDGHHSVEDIGIVLGKLIARLLGDKRGIARYGFQRIPMDEALAEAVIDVSGRPFLVYNAALHAKAGDFDLELIEEFFQGLCAHGGLTLHITLIDGKNNHHKAEAIFKAVARALAEAVRIVSDQLPSSKGVLE